MQSLLNHLNQLQELVLIRDEHRTTGDGSHMERLNDSIDQLTDKLPPEIKSLYQRLYKKDHIVMAPMYNGCCAICGMRLPISQVQSVRLCKQIQNCPSCARILFEESGAPRWVGDVPSRTEPRKSGISRFSAESLMIPDLKATNGREAIVELATVMEQQKFVSGAEKLVASALEREAVLSTAMDNGLAFPHVRGVEGGGLTLALGVAKKGIRYDEAGSIVNLVFFITIPTAVSAFYLRLMSGLTETFLKEQNREAMLAAETPELLWKALIKATRYTIK
ncbi:MAG TPA: PTS sugar transporter subunit IIA [Kiritimatiellia bacterium]|jgi:mannitol/fructose-specific phosphotransferase system IIA component (Ntr-type)|nr:PTS sugar transporter subunit IIA [Kiritimatiellia bacterium]HOM59715.1 PTS sugar transporter subunit IIA [Kiritimatiellia bacterium]HOR97587.1 PTS sugar transporter subunit IIA [Kiritimatiellia bacterium]HPC49278.1 PTS sugar transporter subunit IIA [Kiritimatiellia bacterium]HPK36841.1 PTS sugar transporter subunit IIA [Kiritimatiellia bacterium]